VKPPLSRVHALPGRCKVNPHSPRGAIECHSDQPFREGFVRGRLNLTTCRGTQNTWSASIEYDTALFFQTCSPEEGTTHQCQVLQTESLPSRFLTLSKDVYIMLVHRWQGGECKQLLDGQKGWTDLTTPGLVIVAEDKRDGYIEGSLMQSYFVDNGYTSQTGLRVCGSL